MQQFQMAVSIICSIASVVGICYGVYAFIHTQQKWKDDLINLQQQQNRIHEKTQRELGFINRGIVACLKGLIEQGCDGEVKAALQDLEKYNTKSQHEVVFN